MAGTTSTDNTPTHLVTWRNNKVDQEERHAISDLVDAYYETEWPNVEMMLERKVALFLSAADGPVAGVWEDRVAFDALLDAITARFEAGR